MRCAAGPSSTNPRLGSADGGHSGRLHHGPDLRHMVFGQVVIGPPGSGKTTYCIGLQQYLEGIGRKVAVINLDPANENYTYPVAADIQDLVRLDAAAQDLNLGPNGALVYCYEFLEANLDWLVEKLSELSDCYVLLDMPGQVELYTHHASVKNVLAALQQTHHHRLVAVHLVDAHHCADAAKFISVLLVTLSTMVQLEMPQARGHRRRCHHRHRRHHTPFHSPEHPAHHQPAAP